jgi:predicted metalloprotease with PDZ domain
MLVGLDMNTTEVHFEISFPSPEAHVLRVRCEIANLTASQVDFSLPSWTPGSYLVRDFAQHVTSISASDLTGPLPLAKVNKDTWQCHTSHAELTIIYELYAFDASVRAAFFESSYAFFTGTAVFIRVHGYENSKHELTIHKPAFKSCVATSMPSLNTDEDGFGTYLNQNYDELVDHPVMISDYQSHIFEVEGVKHEIALFPNLEFDVKRLISDCEKICKTQIGMFGSPPPFQRYVFLLKVEEDGYGGLEHRDSSALICKINDLPLKHHTGMTDGYRGLLGLFSHEYFHAWNVKRIKPATFLNYNYNRENYTELLWFFEGFTSYYDDLALRRSGVVDNKSYFDLLSRAISRVHAEQGRFKQTLADASFDAWIKFYKPNENSPNTNVSYYLKGSLVALALDLTIRQLSKGRGSLDDVMRTLWKNYALKDQGVTEAIIRQEANAAAQSNLDSFFEKYVHGLEELPLVELFESVGILLEFKSTQNEVLGATGHLGCLFKREGDFAISHVPTSSPAMKAGLCAGDVIVAINQLRVHHGNFESVLARYAPGDTVLIHVFRRGWLKELTAVLSQAPKTKCDLRMTKNMTKEQDAALNAWLGG